MEHRTAQTQRPQRTRARWRQQMWAVDRRSNGPRLNRAGAEAAQRAKRTTKADRRSGDRRLTAADQNENEEQQNYAPDCTLRPIAGDTGHGSARGSYLQVRNNLTNLLAPLTAPGKDQSGGATTRGGEEPTANGDSTLELRSDQTSEC